MPSPDTPDRTAGPETAAPPAAASLTPPAGLGAIPARLARARSRLADAAVDALIILKPENRTYLTGFTGSAGVAVITPPRAHLLVDFRYVDQAALEAPAFERLRATNLLDALADLLRDLGVRRAGVEADTVTLAQFRRLREKNPDVEVVALEGLDRWRWRKEPGEVDRIRAAVRIADEAFGSLLADVRPGTRERDLAAELEHRMRRLGADGAAFETIVASGPRSALPHGRAADRVLAAGDLVTFDFGAVVAGYHSDCTRTVVLGRATDEQRRVYEVVRDTLHAVEARLRPGMTGREGDALGRDLIAAAGFGEAFGHGLGHGVGLAVHEGPTLSPREEAILEPDAVVTIEPGIYRTGWGGVRIEDLVVLRGAGVEVLTSLPTALLEL